jgi:spermidine synthase
VVFVLFFLSGLSALVYQVVWQRQLSTVFGVTVYATSTVLAAFMAGLALGSLMGGRLADRARRPLLLFAAAEAGVGLLAAATPWGLELATSIFTALHARFGLGFGGLTAVRLACSFALLLVPTTFMGATLPLVVAAERGRGATLGSRVALLYGVNTLGAFTGAVLAGYRLVGALGLEGSLRVGVALNLCVALVASLLARRASGVPEPSLSSSPASPSSLLLSRAQAAALLAAFGLSGFVALALEVVWVRMLLAYLPTTTYAFTTMLATVLAGIGLGGLLATRGRTLDAAHEIARLGAWLVGIGTAGVFAANVLARTYAAGWRTSGMIQACVVSLLPATILMGMAYPRALAVWAQAKSRVGWRVGAFSAVNLGGGIAGALAGGFAFVPLLGARGGLMALCALSAVSGLGLAATAGRAVRVLAVPLVIAAVGVVAAVTLPDPWQASLARRHPGEVEMWRAEGAQATVAVHREADGGRVLYIDGIHQAGDDLEICVTHRRIGLVPLLLHPQPRRALVIGLAGGVTPGTIALDPAVKLDIVELSKEVARGSEFFVDLNGGLLRRPNVRLKVDDGRNHLLLTRERYDIITADLVQPFHAGAGNLYSAEYFQLCRRALTPNGMMVQWIGHPPERQYKMILRTFLSVFPETTMWGQAFLVGSPSPLRVHREAFDRARSHPELAAALAASRLDSVEALQGWYTAGPEELRRFAGEGPILTDDRPLVEYYLSLPGPARPIDLTGLKGDPSALISQ